MDVLNLRDRTVAVTGAGGGIGRAIAVAFATLGARVHAADLSAEALADAAASIPGLTATAAVDLTDRAAATAWVRGIEAPSPGGAVEVLVNNAGGSMGQVPRPIEETADADWDRILDLNLDASFALCRAVAPAMRRARFGRIVNISSGAGLRVSLHGVLAYTAAKHTAVGLTRPLAMDLGPGHHGQQRGAGADPDERGARAAMGPLRAGRAARDPEPDRPAPARHRGGDRQGGRVPRLRPGELREQTGPAGRWWIRLSRGGTGPWSKR
jgi:NAD(P)-dependent dehydrogenase (short-subunit alcohol dehydrogenase family)